MNALLSMRMPAPVQRLPRMVQITGVVFVVIALVTAAFFGTRAVVEPATTTVSGYFDNANGLYVGDQVRILGVGVGKVREIDAEPNRVKIVFDYASKYRVPAGANAVVISPSLVSSRSIQLTPAYTGGPVMAPGAVIPQDRTAVPVEWDDFRQQLKKLNDTLGPSEDGKTGLGSFLDTASANLDGQGPSINDTLAKLSQAFGILGDKSTDIFSTVRNLQIFVSALVTSSDLLSRLNANLAAVTTELSNEPDEVGNAVASLDTAVTDVATFVRDNRDKLSTSVARLDSVTTELNAGKGELESLLHIAPTSFQNFINIYQPAQSALTGILAFNNFANPIQFICAGVQAASKKGAQESANLCAQYLGPVLKNLLVNFPALGLNPITGATDRPNEITYSEDRLKGAVPGTGPGPLAPNAAAPPAAQAAVTLPSAGPAPRQGADNRGGLIMPGLQDLIPGGPR